mmetsp:Transcript_115831/g.327706  ORF Transcript_115831/g.327706 Transcript_115831/m.327706 type:complete len:152 (+) Transcript_115831:2273-2728(+)
MESRFWKPKGNEDPRQEWHWLPRRMWINRSGHVWYESVKEGKPALHLDGMSLRDVILRKASDGEAVAEIEGAGIFVVACEWSCMGDKRRLCYMGLKSEQERDEVLRIAASLKAFPVPRAKRRSLVRARAAATPAASLSNTGNFSSSFGTGS